MNLKDRNAKRQSVVNKLIEDNNDNNSKDDFIQRSYFITHEQFKQIGYEKIETGETASAIVRKALDYYFSNR